MFYSEYRPQKFSELIGADHIVSILTASLAKEKVAHAYFFTGGRGIGKTTTARLLAMALMCEKPQKIEKPSEKYPNLYFEPCGKCKSCMAVKKGNHLDLIEIDAASNRGIDDIRILRDNVHLSPTTSKRKVYIIDEVHMLTTEASNALLKTLEEPPEHAYFILCTTNPEKVLDTIKSRCIQIQFKIPATTNIVNKLKFIAVDKGLDIADDVYEQIAKMAKGAFREAETYFEQYVNSGNSLETLISDNSDSFLKFYELILDKDLEGSMKYIQELYESGISIENWTLGFVDYLRKLLLLKVGVINIDSFGYMAVTKEIITSSSAAEIKDTLKVFMEVPKGFKDAIIPTLPLEIALVELLPENEQKRSEKEMTLEIPKKKSEEKSHTVAVENVVDKKPAKVDKSKAIVEEVKEKPAEKQAVAKEITKPMVSKEFPYKKLIDSLKETNHSIYLILSSCKLKMFDGKNLTLSASYSFHKERVLGNKIRNIIEEVSTSLNGSQVVLHCDLNEKNPDATKLTDKNLVVPNKTPLADVFNNVFGDSLEAISE